MKKNYQIRSVPRMFEEVTKQIIQYIEEEKLESGAKIPTERKLAELLGVSRSSIREGLRILELLKHLESRQGDGTFVSVPPPFLIPVDLIHQNLDFNTKKNYFEVSLMCAEKIAQKSLDTEHMKIEHLIVHQGKDYWQNLSNMLNKLAESLENNYYVTLWNSIYDFLDKDCFFEGIPVPNNLEVFKSALLSKDELQINQMFNHLYDIVANKQ